MYSNAVFVSVILTANWLACLAIIMWFFYSIKCAYGRTLANCINYSPWIYYLKNSFIVIIALICIYSTSDNSTCRGQSSKKTAHDSQIQLQQEKVKNVQKKMDNNEKKMKSEQLENMEKELNNLDKRLANVARQLELMREQLELMGKQLELMAKQLELMAKLLHGKSKTFLTVFGFQFIPIAGLLAIVLYIGILITLTIIRFGLHGISARNISEMMRSRTARTVFVIIFIMMLLNLVVQWNLQQELKELR